MERLPSTSPDRHRPIHQSEKASRNFRPRYDPLLHRSKPQKIQTMFRRAGRKNQGSRSPSVPHPQHPLQIPPQNAKAWQECAKEAAVANTVFIHKFHDNFAEAHPPHRRPKLHPASPPRAKIQREHQNVLQEYDEPHPLHPTSLQKINRDKECQVVGITPNVG